jgi:NADPH:quinone reductase-like Zn-dependent oxidoreductase
MKAVRFDRYGGIEVLQVVDVPMPEPSHGEALVKVKAASINPGEAKIREGLLHAMWPATFPSGEGSDLAGVVTKVGPGVESFTVGDEGIGFTDRRASHAEYVVVEAKNLTIKPVKVPWEVADSLAMRHTWKAFRGPAAEERRGFSSREVAHGRPGSVRHSVFASLSASMDAVMQCYPC